MPPSIKHLEPVKAKEVWIAFDRSPAFVRMMIQHRETHLLQRPLVGRRRPGMVKDPVRRTFAVMTRIADEDHRVIWKLLYPWLMEEDQISSVSSVAIAAHE